jgi:uncharacterized membrane protein
LGATLKETVAREAFIFSFRVICKKKKKKKKILWPPVAMLMRVNLIRVFCFFGWRPMWHSYAGGKFSLIFVWGVCVGASIFFIVCFVSFFVFFSPRRFNSRKDCQLADRFTGVPSSPRSLYGCWKYNSPA